MRSLLLVCACVIVCAFRLSPSGYDGNNLFAVIGQNITSPVFKEFKEFWQLDKSWQNAAEGIKIYINLINDNVESIIIAGEGLDMGGSKFTRCPNALPFGITLNDDTSTLVSRLGTGEKLLGRNTLKFYKDGIAIEASYTDLKTGKIYFLKFNACGKRLVTAPAPSVSIPAPVVNAFEKQRQREEAAFVSPGTVKETTASMPVQLQVVAKKDSVRRKASVPLPVASRPMSKEDVIEKNRRLQEAAFVSGERAQPASKPVEKVRETPGTPLKRAILDVFKAAHGYSLDSLKTDERHESNFWNYKFTYNTKIKVPGEKYNMLYSFPFINSQLDFVVVLKESDGYDKSYETMYHNFEKQLTENFPASEGWTSTCLAGKDKKELPDLEFRNDKYGAVILDHSQNPRGRHVLYLRFLLFAD